VPLSITFFPPPYSISCYGVKEAGRYLLAVCSLSLPFSSLSVRSGSGFPSAVGGALTSLRADQSPLPWPNVVFLDVLVVFSKMASFA